MKNLLLPFLLAASAIVQAQDSSAIHYPQEKHFKNVHQLTFGGDNAEAYWNFKGTALTYQYTNKKAGVPCDRIYFYPLSRFLTQQDTILMPTPVSSGEGRTTCSFFLPGDSLVLYASTVGKIDTCPAEPPHVKGKYLWPLYPEYEIYVSDLNGNIVKKLTDNNFYDAEATVSPKGDKIVFTSDRSGDVELYTMNIDGSGLKQITNELGYDGGACFSPDDKQIVWRSTKFDSEQEKEDYKELLKKHLVSPNKMELYIANADGSNRRKLTDLGGANWAPYFSHSGKKVIFSSNHVTKSIPFNLYMINTDGTGLEQISYDKIFDSFAMFTADGKRIAWCSNRNNGGTRDTNIFIADWVE